MTAEEGCRLRPHPVKGPVSQGKQIRECHDRHMAEHAGAFTLIKRISVVGEKSPFQVQTIYSFLGEGVSPLAFIDLESLGRGSSYLSPVSSGIVWIRLTCGHVCQGLS